MTDIKDKSVTEDTINNKMIEVLAYQLFAKCRNENIPVAAEAEWKDAPSTRTEWRVQARRFSELLEASGLRMQLASQRKLDAAITELTVIPARFAYTLE